jgi:glycosyltransferase involved in cell wall biosynthesis
MNISVVVCTYNRGELLNQTIESILNQSLSIDSYEIIIVDNNSTDKTASIVYDLQKAHTRLIYVFEPELGLSNARNRGLAEAKGDFVAFIDDDAIADPDWLINLWQACILNNRVVGVGGKIDLIWSRKRPSWLPDELLGYLGNLDLNSELSILKNTEYPYGGNMAIKRKHALKMGGFSKRLGRKGGNLISSEEQELFFRLAADKSGVVVYTPFAIVHHIVPPARLTLSYFLKRSYAQGVSNIILHKDLSEEDRGSVVGLKAYLKVVKPVLVCLFLITKTTMFSIPNILKNNLGLISKDE